jgi:hypothetical protein
MDRGYSQQKGMEYRRLKGLGKKISCRDLESILKETTYLKGLSKVI